LRPILGTTKTNRSHMTLKNAQEWNWIAFD
jgi:hypothetical protein